MCYTWTDLRSWYTEIVCSQYSYDLVTDDADRLWSFYWTDDSALKSLPVNINQEKS